MTYIDEARDRLSTELPGLDYPLLDLYTLLVLTRGESATLEDVHDAWSVWRTRTQPDRRSIVPFKELTPEVQELDRKYLQAIIYVAITLRQR
jgi:hypothetical protein